MNKGHLLCMIVTCIFFLVACTSDIDEQTAAEFFQKYIDLGEAFDREIIELYADHAVIKARRVYPPHGLERILSLDGIKWKKLLLETLPMSRAKGDISKFSNIKIEVAGRKATIKADRYSLLKCYADKEYYMVIERMQNDAYKIIEEFMVTQPQSDCTES